MPNFIIISLKLAGQDQDLETDNVLLGLRSLEIEPLKIKSLAQFEFKYQGKVFRKVFKIMQLKRLLTNDIYRQIIAKLVNTNLGITGENLYV